MKEKRKINKWNSLENNEAVSPVIGTILMVAVTVILAAVIGMFCFNMTGEIKKTPLIAFEVKNIPETKALDLAIAHKGGDSLYADLWAVSITKVGVPPSFNTSNKELNAGDYIIATTDTTGNATVNNSAVVGGAALVNGKYHILLKEDTTKKVLVDAIIEVTGR